MIPNQDRDTHQHLFWKIITFLASTLGGILVAVTSVILFMTVLFRYVLHMPLGWTEELSRLLFMWIAFLGAALCAANEGHTRFELFAKRLKPKPRIILDILCSVLILVITVVFVIAGFQGLKGISFERFVILDITYGWGYIALPVAAVLILIYYLRHLYTKIRRARTIYQTGEWIQEEKQGHH
ncbi:MAG: TRAP transporter small permease [Pseudomonadota bacterium]